jgi:pimeloyl-ACP methyl ester carboxylesterase
MRRFYCIWTLGLLLAVHASAQTVPATQRPSGYTVFLRGVPIGREDVTVRTDADGIVITADARRTPPAVIASGRMEIRYGSDWTPRTLSLESTDNNQQMSLRTTFKDGAAVSEGSQAGKPVAKTDKVASDTLILPNGFFGAHVALARRLDTMAAPAPLRAYIAPLAEVAIRVVNVSSQRIQTGAATLDVKRYDLLLSNPVGGGDLEITLSVDSRGELVSVAVPAQTIDVVRDDVSAATSRLQTHSNPGDQPATIPAAGFNLGATMTRPQGVAPTMRLPAVILVPGSGVGDRDGVIAGVPILGQLAGALADAGFVAVRFDKRGYGQSGGRAESATLGDFADDAIAVQKWLASRRDIDPKRIAIAGHSEGAWVALLAASRERRIAAVVSIAAPSGTGAELVLEQQQQALDRLNLPPAERQEKIELQAKIHSAVITGRGWEGLPVETRRQADTPWFQSLLMFNPAKVVEDVRQPVLFIHGALDKQVPATHADRIADLTRKESKSKSVSVVTVRGVNHLLVPAVTGEVEEYGTLPSRAVSSDVTMAVSDWLTRTFQAIR